MSLSWKGGSTRQWRKLRAAVLLANANTNAGRCALEVGRRCPKHGRPCPGVCTGLATVVHHAKGKGVSERVADMVASCAACNGHVGSPSRWPSSSPAPRPYSRW